MIRIKRPVLRVQGEDACLSADIVLDDGVVRPLWVRVEKRFSDFLCFERSDAFVLGLLHYAMKAGQDIESECAMTDRLYEQITDQFLPAYSKINGIREIRIDVPQLPEVQHPQDGDAVGTGCSCGVDSMHVYASHPEVTHGCVWNVHGITNDETDDDRRVAWRNLVSQAKRFTDAVGRELVVADSNYDRGCIPDLAFDGSTTYGNLFFIFAFQKLWKCFYVASGYDIGDFSLTLGVSADPAHYEYLLFPFCSMSHIRVLLDGAAHNRYQKTADLVAYDPSRRFLNVCWRISDNGKNCTCYCPKCMRTLLDLAALDATEEFAGVFDVDYYNSHQEEFLAEYWRGLIQKNPYALEIRATYGRKKFPLSIRLRAVIILARKILKKLLRLGGTSQRFSPRG